ncbi:hypothetical protein P9112_000857 [Eukaryota sp. TZLM1-RC]
MTPTDVPTLLKNAENAFSKNNPELAFEFLERAVSLDPSNPKALDGLAEGLLYLGNTAAAKSNFLKAAEVAPLSNIGRYMYLGQLSESHEALQHYLTGIEAIGNQDLFEDERNQMLCNAYVSIADLYLTDLCFEPNAESECEKYLNLALQTSTDNPDVFLTFCSFRLSQQRPDQAKEMLLKFDQLYALDPEQVTPMNKLNAAKFHFEVGNVGACLEYADVVLSSDDTNIDALIVYATALHSDGDGEEAVEVVEKAKSVALMNGWNEVVADFDSLIERFKS